MILEQVRGFLVRTGNFETYKAPLLDADGR
jgi:hypothetical protein